MVANSGGRHLVGLFRAVLPVQYRRPFGPGAGGEFVTVPAFDETAEGGDEAVVAVGPTATLRPYTRRARSASARAEGSVSRRWKRRRAW